MKLKAFTLIDMLIGMILSAIVISMGMGGLQSINQALEKNKTFQLQRLNESNTIRYFIYDAEQADSIIQDGHFLKFYSSSDTIDWRFNESEILRKNERLDNKALIKVMTNNMGLAERFEISFNQENVFFYKKDYRSLKLNKIGH